MFDECKNGDEVCEKYTRRSSLDGVHYFKVTDVADKSVNRLWLKLFAEAKEHIYGGWSFIFKIWWTKQVFTAISIKLFFFY